MSITSSLMTETEVSEKKRILINEYSFHTHTNTHTHTHTHTHSTYIQTHIHTNRHKCTHTHTHTLYKSFTAAGHK